MDIFIDIHPTRTELCDIMTTYGSDKGDNHQHNYTQYYYELFKNIRNNNLRIFELGLGTNNINLPSNMGINGKPGASLRGWKHFFSNSNIFGADIDKNILFEEDRIKTYYCDQNSPYDIKNMWNNQDLIEDFDIIIEDGMHEFEYNVTFFENSIHKVKSNGVFIIEDIKQIFLSKWIEQLNMWKNKYPNLIFRLYNIPFTNPIDNCLIIAQKI